MTYPHYLACLLSLMLASGLAGMQLVSLSGDTLHPNIDCEDIRIVGHASNGILVQAGQTGDWPNIAFFSGEKPWDLSRFSTVKVDISNTGASSAKIGVRIDNPGVDKDSAPQAQGFETFAPGESRTLTVRMLSEDWRFSKPVELFGMRRAPGQVLIRTDRVDKIQVFVRGGQGTKRFIISNIRADGEVRTVDPAGFLPFVDPYGQYAHQSWPTKVHSDADLKRLLRQENADIKAHPGPENFNRFGGYLDGPQLEATGYFRVEKYEGKWWFVDPEGRLFWSNGPTCISPDFGYTGVSDRETYFQSLPKDGDPLTKFYKEGTWAPHGFYADKMPYRLYQFYKANLFRKYGDTWFDHYTDSIHRRLRSWGMNTIANWASPNIYLEQRTPYVANIFITGNQPLEASTGYWGKFHDVFDPSFRNATRKGLRTRTQEAGDPWCIGFFVDNELQWGNELSLALETLACPSGQPAKQVFVNDLKDKYSDIRTLNRVWGSSYESWNGLLQSTDSPDTALASEDLRAFTAKIADTYFSTIKEELKAIAPNHLYLGCRFAWVNDIVAHAAAIHCDVVSYNKYEHSIRNLHLPDYVDRPIIIGEYHFGSTDWGHFHPGLLDVPSQEERGKAYIAYIKSALENPYVVGAHWFQFVDEHIAGRGDGENYNVGLVDICDTPYPFMVDALRNVSAHLYPYRLNEKE